MTEYDAIIIGAGMGGAASAYALTKHGLKVLLLEAGPAYDPARDYRLDQPDWEAQRFPFKPGSQGRHTHGKRQRLEDKRWAKLRSWNQTQGLLNPSGERNPGVYHHVRGVGGSTLHFTGEAHRLHPQAMRMRSRFGVAADWPLSYPELEPYYVEAERVIGVSGPATTPQRPRSAPYPLPPHAPSYAEQKLATGFAELELGWEPNPLAVLSRAYQGRPPCNYCAGCNRGCPRRDKGSADVTFIPAALASGRCSLKTGVQVLHLAIGPGDELSGVVYARADGGLERLKAPLLILAAGAVETPRLLLASDNLANDSGQVGQHFMETLFMVSSALHPEPLGSHRGLPGSRICWDFNAPDAIDDLVGGCRFAPGMAEADLLGPVQYATRVLGGWGRSHKQAMRQACGNVLSIGGLGEFLPNSHTYIDLDPEQKDTYGMPLARIHSHLSETDLRRLGFIAAKNREILRAAGATRIFEQYGTYDFFNTTHVFGTCRMGTDTRSSVVNPYQRSHRWRNLYIADASVFPSCGGGESPSLTIAALALRMGEHIASGA